MDYDKLSDEELAFKAKDGDAQATEILIKRCRHIVLGVARSYYLVGGDADDIVQEGTIGAFRAISTYNGKTPFMKYAYLCIKSAVLSLIRKSSRDKNKPLYNYLSLSSCSGELGNAEIIPDENFDPEREYINKESEIELRKRIYESLSKFEYTVLELFLEGFTYAEIADKISKPEKAIDNALQRIRKKLAAASGING